MSEYLSKEEIKQWRSSLEKITLEEYAKRLGKVLKEEKQTRDIIDIVLSDSKKNENIKTFSSKIINPAPKGVVSAAAKKVVNLQNNLVQEQKNEIDKKQFTFKKPLTQREQVVLDYFLSNTDKIVYAKDLAKILDLPTDYVYKYIKNLRAKISEDILQNAVKGGYKLTI